MLTNKSTCHVAILTFICIVQMSGDLWTRVSTPEYLCRRSATEKCPYPHAHTANPPIPMHFSHYRWNHGSVPRCPRRVPTMEKCWVEWNPSARLNCSSTGFVVSRVVSFENLSDVDTARNFDRSKRWISRSFVREINARYDGIRQDQQFVRTDSYETYFDTLYMRDSGRKLWRQMTKCLVWKNRFKKNKLKRDIRRDNIKIKKFSA